MALAGSADKRDEELAAYIREVFLQRAKEDESAAATICDFPCSEMERDPGILNFADWYEENAHRIVPGGEAEKAAEQVRAYCDAWLRRTRFTRSD